MPTMKLNLKPLLIVALLLAPAAAQAQVIQTSAGELRVNTIAKDLSRPWALQFLPDGRMIVTERPGNIRIVGKDGALSPPLEGVPKVLARGQGGMLDIALDRNFKTNATLYECFAD